MWRVLDKAREKVAAARRESGLAPEDATYLAVPYQSSSIIAQDPEHRAALIERIDHAIEEAFRLPALNEPSEYRRDIDAEEAPAVSAACQTCRGHCCETGRDRLVFIDARTVQEFRAHVPHLDAAAVRSAYVDRIPEASVEGSCAYSGASGCALDRAQRSAVCNTHFCGPMHLLQESGLIDGPGPFVVMAIDEEEAVLRVFEGSSGLRKLDGETRAADADSPIVEEIIAQMPSVSPEASRYALDGPTYCVHCGSEAKESEVTCGGHACRSAEERRRFSGGVGPSR